MSSRQLLLASVIAVVLAFVWRLPGHAADAPAPLGIDESALDAAQKPCDDFFAYACGGWLKRTSIPAEHSTWMRSFSEIEERNQKLLRDILDGMRAKKSTDPYADKLVGFYDSCMDEDKIERAAFTDLAALRAEVDAITSLEALARYLGQAHLRDGGGGNAPLFFLHAQQDLRDATRVVANLEQGGLTLPDRDYYTSDASNFPALREKLRAHIARMLELAGLAAAQAKADADTVLAIEKALAEASLTRVERREPEKLYHRLELSGVTAAAPKLAWKTYLGALGHPAATEINVEHPPFLARINELLGSRSLADWRAYLRWHAIHRSAPSLAKRFVDEDFAFTQKALLGTDVLPPRWKRCVNATDAMLGEALARPFVRQTFGDEGKRETQRMVHEVEGAMQHALGQLAWMDAATHKPALAKLAAIANKIGFPDKWRAYDGLAVDAAQSYFANARRARAFNANFDLDHIGKPVDRSRWEMTPPTVNAYYEPALNEMVFPAGILQPPFYFKSAPAAVNYGAIGMVMGHELTHGFDDEGRQYDARGNLADWWSAASKAEFEKRASCVVKQFDGYTVLDNLHLNGKLTLGENIADLGGLKLAHAAWAGNRKGAPGKHGRFSDEQLFFLGYAQAWCGKQRDEILRVRTATNPHSPPQYRVNGPLANLPEFAAAFQCKPGDKMVRRGEEACVIW